MSPLRSITPPCSRPLALLSPPSFSLLPHLLITHVLYLSPPMTPLCGALNLFLDSLETFPSFAMLNSGYIFTTNIKKLMNSFQLLLFYLPGSPLALFLRPPPFSSVFSTLAHLLIPFLHPSVRIFWSLTLTLTLLFNTTVCSSHARPNSFLSSILRHLCPNLFLIHNDYAPASPFLPTTVVGSATPSRCHLRST